jgi:hypothetical protein
MPVPEASEVLRRVESCHPHQIHLFGLYNRKDENRKVSWQPLFLYCLCFICIAYDNENLKLQ